MSYKLNKSEIEKLMKGLVITVDRREKQGTHIVKHFAENDIEYVPATLLTGDYGAYIKANPELGILRDIHIDAVVERKAHADELCGNLQKSTEKAFQNELIRSKDIPFTILVEDQLGYQKIISGQYRSGYKPDALIGRLNSLKAAYSFEIVYLDSRWSGDWIYRHLYYQAREYLKKL